MVYFLLLYTYSDYLLLLPVLFDCQSPRVAAGAGISTQFWSKMFCIGQNRSEILKPPLLERHLVSHVEPQKERFMSRLCRYW